MDSTQQNAKGSDFAVDVKKGIKSADTAALADLKNFSQQYVIQNKLRNGQHSTVHMAYDKNIHDRMLAVKVYDKRAMSDEDIESMNNQVEVLYKLDHPNIVRFYEQFQKKDHFYMVMEFCPGGTLLELLEAN